MTPRWVINPSDQPEHSGQVVRLSEADRRFRLGPSSVFGAGTGVFAVQPLDEGDRLEIIGVRIHAETPSDQCTAYADMHKFRIGDELLLPVGFGGMVNHSDAPNVAKELDNDRLYFRAMRAIAAGEEIFLAYNEKAKERMGLK